MRPCQINKTFLNGGIIMKPMLSLFRSIAFILFLFCSIGFAAVTRIEAEDYTNMSGVDTETTSDTGGGLNVGWIENGDWTEYGNMIAITNAGLYRFDFRVASGTSGGTIGLLVDGTPVQSVRVENTGGWQEWITVSTTVSFGAAGNYTLRLHFTGDSGYLFNVNWFEYEYDPSGNAVPEVNAGSPQIVRFDQTATATLEGSVMDDDPNDLGQIGVDYGIIQWTCPANGSVVFTDASDPQTTVTFPRDGYYELVLYAQDDVGKESTDTVILNVCIPGQYENRLMDMVNLMTVSERIQELDANYSAGVARLELPSYNYWNEALHGVGRQGLATVFPECISMGAMWDDELLREIFSAVSDEARVKANTTGRGLTYWTPTINLARDPRWGRNEETYSEDPYLLSRMAAAVVKGLQGNDPNYLKTVATAKHFIANNTESGRHNTSSDVDVRNLRELYMPAFRAAITEGKAFSVMAAYNALNGIPCPANTWLLRDVLRAEWGFEGYVVSDCGAIGDIYTGHHYASSEAEACAMGINGGTNLNCGSYYQDYLQDAYDQGLVTEAAIDLAVQEVLRARFRLGEFDPPELVPYTSIPDTELDCQEHRDLALLAARKSMVLLKNEGILPLDKNAVSSVAVMGPNANRAILGGYSGTPPYAITPLAGIEQKLSGSGVTVQYLKGCSISDTDMAIDAQYLKPSSGSGDHGLTGEYYNNETLSGTPALTQLDYNVDFEWGEGSPAAGVSSDYFSIRWSGVLTAPATQTYQIGVRSDDGFRLYLNGALIAEDWTVHSVRTKMAAVNLTAGQEYDIVLEYFDAAKDAVVKLVWDYETTDFSSVAALAAASDVVIVCVGTDLDVADESNDMDQYQMPGLQEEMIQAIYAANPNTVVVLINGNPIGFEWTADHVPGILEAWYAGQSQGTAIADVLFGDYNPGGRLPQTFYQSESQLPDFYDYDIIGGGRTYQYYEGDVQYPFGHGLSYTQFEYSNINITPAVIDTTGQVVVAVNVENAGSVAGDEVIQVYVHDLDASVKTPIRALKGFERVHLQPGEKVTKSFTLRAEDLMFFDSPLDDFRLELGEFEVQIGSSSADIRQTGRFWVLDTSSGDLTGNGKVDMEDMASLASVWLSSLDIDTLAEVAGNWLYIKPVSFVSDPIIEIEAVEGISYSSTLSDDVVYYDISQLVFNKSSGPDWLAIDPDGDLSGTPAAPDVGDNNFTVQVDDFVNPPVQVALEISVEAAVAPMEGVVNVNFVKSGYSNIETGAGVLGTGTAAWNVLAADQNQSGLGLVTLTDVVDSTGTATTVDVVYDCQSRGSWTSSGVQSATLPATNGRYMMESYLTTQNAANYVYIQGLEADSYYDLYLFGHGDDEAQNTQFTINGTTKGSTINVTGLTGLTENAHYVVFQNVAPDTNGEIQINFSNGPDNEWGAFSGLQIMLSP